MNRLAPLVGLILLATLTAPARGAELAGVSLPEAVEVAGRSLQLQGLGLRRKFFFKVYVGALYLATPAAGPREAIETREPKRITLHFLRDVGEADLREAFDEGFFNNSQERLDRLRDRIDAFHRLLEGGVEKGQTVAFTYLPGSGTRVTVDGELRGSVPGEEFMEALWAVWLGPVPPDHDLKRAMLGNR